MCCIISEMTLAVWFFDSGDSNYTIIMSAILSAISVCKNASWFAFGVININLQTEVFCNEMDL